MVEWGVAPGFNSGMGGAEFTGAWLQTSSKICVKTGEIHLG